MYSNKIVYFLEYVIRDFHIECTLTSYYSVK